MLELRRFYVYLNQLAHGAILRIQNGVSEAYVLRNTFFDEYDAGYRLVIPNVFDPVPQIDRWMIAANNRQRVTYGGLLGAVSPLDFSLVADDQLRTSLKKWFWNELTIGLPQKIKHVKYVISFLQQRDQLRANLYHKFLEIRNNSVLDVEGTILAEEVFLCVQEWQQTLTKNSFKSKIQPVCKFLSYLSENKKYCVDTVAFGYLTSQGVSDNKKPIPPISDEDCMLLETRLRQQRSENLASDLRYVIFCLLILTPLRIDSIFLLEENCAIQNGHNNYVLRIDHKAGHGDKRDVPTSMYVYRLINYVREITSEIRSKAPAEMRKYLFLCESRKGIYSPVTKINFHQYITRTCNDLGLPHYSAQNLRKSYMTRVVTKAIKQGISLEKINSVTSHQSFRTTAEHYVRPDIREYLEAIYAVLIDNSTTRGFCTQQYDNGSGAESVVENGCGYCRNSECNIWGTASCLMCSYFVTTPEQLPYFEDAVSVIDKQLQACDNPHDRKHLYMIKVLIIKYIARLLTITEEERE